MHQWEAGERAPRPRGGTGARVRKSAHGSGLAVPRGGADSCVRGGWGREWVKGGSVNRATGGFAAVLPPLRATLEEPRLEMEEDEQEQRRRKVEAGRAKVASSSPLLPWREILWGFRCSHCRLTEAVVAERWKLPSERSPFPPLLRNSLPSRRHLESTALGLAPPRCGPGQSASETHVPRRRAERCGRVLIA